LPNTSISSPIKALQLSEIEKLVEENLPILLEEQNRDSFTGDFQSIDKSLEFSKKVIQFIDLIGLHPIAIKSLIAPATITSNKHKAI